MAGVLLSEETLDAVLKLIVTLALQTLSSAAAVSVSLTRDGRLVTSAYSHESALTADEAQYEANAGPCVEALSTAQPVFTGALAVDTRWPLFRDAALQEGFASVLSLPLGGHEVPATGAALNLYSGNPEGFDDGQATIGKLFAEQAGILVANARLQEDAAELSTNLRTALESRELIGEAKGILMERERVSGEEAFEMLRRLSQNSNVKLRDVAARIVDSVKLPNKPKG